MNKRPLKEVKDKSLKDIYDGISMLSTAANPGLLTVTNIAKRSGYSIGNIYHHFRGIDDLLLNFAIDRSKERCTLLIKLIDLIPSTSTAITILKIINDANFDYLKFQTHGGVFKKLSLNVLSQPNLINGLDKISLLLVDPIEKMINRNQTNTFKKMTKEEIEMAVLTIMSAKRKAFAFNHKLSGTIAHKQQCLSIWVALFAK
ncbi:DNA-binding HTH domain, TetR-type [Methylophilaceae bacterium]